MKKSKMMVFVLCACLLLPFAVQAQEYYTLPEIREQAAAGWHETYTDKYGRTIPVDLEIDVFGEDVAPVLRIQDMDDDWPNPDLLDEGTVVDWEEGKGSGRFSIDKDRPWSSIAPPKRPGGKRKNVYVSFGEWLDYHEPYLADYGNNMTVGEAVEFFCQLLEKHGIDKERFNFEYPESFYAICGMDLKTNTPKSVGFYYMNLYSQFYKIPVLTHAMDSFEHQGWPAFIPRAVFEIRDQDEYLVVIDTMKEAEKLADDIPLCSFSKVIENLEEQIEAGNIQKVNSLRFGYALYNEPGHPAERRDLDNWNQADYFAVPSWVIECGYVSDPKQNWTDIVDEEWKAIQPEGDLLNAERNHTSYITINAQTGEMLNPMDLSKGKTHNSPNGTGDADYKGFISWDKVQ